MITLKEFKDKYIGKMIESGIESAAFDFNYILQEVSGISKTDIIINPDKTLTEEQTKCLSTVFERYIKGEPLQYILGYTWFMNNKFSVAPGVLIPRSDTEVVCEKAISYLNNFKKPSVIDMCTGSGCIGLSIASACPSASVYLCDISPVAMEISCENSSSLGLSSRVKILKGDLFKALDSLKTSQKYQMIISNPPYISREIIKLLDSRVRDHEPILALDGGIDGLDFYRKIISEASLYLKNDGMLIFETGYDQTEAVASLMEESGFYKDIERFKDYGGNYRGVSGIYKGDSQ
ncbi:MAG: peptide chain release factor N(5)-glutamine methyltransferase [Ruminococcaceae bacterium]|nr:peptide chain release factor N(5)-glutamine methyltransferase [Oscillospiraceae bacterium]